MVGGKEATPGRGVLLCLHTLSILNRGTLKGKIMSTTIRKNSQGYGYRYTDLAEIHRHMEEVGMHYWQEVETIDDADFIITHILDASDKVIRKCRGCRVVKVSGKNPAQDYGSALTYARRYSLLLAFGLATADDDAAGLTVEPKSIRASKKSTATPTATPKGTKSEAMMPTDKPYRKAGVDAVKQLLDSGAITLAEVKSEVRRYGADKISDLPPDAFVRCVAALTQGRMA